MFALVVLPGCMGSLSRGTEAVRFVTCGTVNETQERSS